MYEYKDIEAIREELIFSNRNNVPIKGNWALVGEQIIFEKWEYLVSFQEEQIRYERRTISELSRRLEMTQKINFTHTSSDETTSIIQEIAACNDRILALQDLYKRFIERQREQ